ncbi:PepSY domain-containing protein [Gracilibacillus lacisalsi]|uniref:PepSY domain-containing protein n=1 Tax=Gracilibacillus lacisalsi TaxID=393087 RepID=UPI00037C958B|nr:PepSY domain-containing protein [Gracilibacillus lacisalsi]
MKKKLLYPLIVVAIIGGVFAIYHFTSSPADAYLSEEEAKEKISKQYSGEIAEIELEEENNQKIYKVKIKGTDRDYELKIDAESGEVLLLNEKAVTESDNSTRNEDTAVDDNTEQEDNSGTNNKEDRNDSSNEETKQQPNNTLISAEEARDIALDQYPGAEITDFEQDEDDGRYLYEIELITDKEEIDLEIDAYTGSIISISKDELDED